MIAPTLGKTAKAAIYHVIYKGEVVRIGETINMRARLSQYRSEARHRKNPLPMHLAMREDWENITFKIVMYVPYAERLTWEANEKKFYETGSKWNDHEKEETGSNNCSANGRKTGPENMAKMPKEILIANGRKSMTSERASEFGRNFNPELRKANGRKTGSVNIAKIPKSTLQANGRNTKNGGNLNAKCAIRRNTIARYLADGLPIPPRFLYCVGAQV